MCFAFSAPDYRNGRGALADAESLRERGHCLQRKGEAFVLISYYLLGEAELSEEDKVKNSQAYPDTVSKSTEKEPALMTLKQKWEKWCRRKTEAQDVFTSMRHIQYETEGPGKRQG